MREKIVGAFTVAFSALGHASTLEWLAGKFDWPSEITQTVAELPRWPLYLVAVFGFWLMIRHRFMEREVPPFFFLDRFRFWQPFRIERVRLNCCNPKGIALVGNFDARITNRSPFFVKISNSYIRSRLAAGDDLKLRYGTSAYEEIDRLPLIPPGTTLDGCVEFFDRAAFERGAAEQGIQRDGFLRLWGEFDFVLSYRIGRIAFTYRRTLRAAFIHAQLYPPPPKRKPQILVRSSTQ